MNERGRRGASVSLVLALVASAVSTALAVGIVGCADKPPDGPAIAAAAKAAIRGLPSGDLAERVSAEPNGDVAVTLSMEWPRSRPDGYGRPVAIDTDLPQKITATVLSTVPAANSVRVFRFDHVLIVESTRSTSK